MGGMSSQLQEGNLILVVSYRTKRSIESEGLQMLVLVCKDSWSSTQLVEEQVQDLDHYF